MDSRPVSRLLIQQVDRRLTHPWLHLYLFIHFVSRVRRMARRLSISIRVEQKLNSGLIMVIRIIIHMMESDFPVLLTGQLEVMGTDSLLPWIRIKQ